MYNLQLSYEEIDLLRVALKKQLLSTQIDAEAFERQVERQTGTNYFSKTYITLRRETYQARQLELSNLLSKLNAATT